MIKHLFLQQSFLIFIRGIYGIAISYYVNPVGKTTSPLVFTSRSRNDLSGGINMNPNWKDNLKPFEIKYPILESVFEEGELKYYFIGFIAADGDVNKTRKRSNYVVELCLNVKDISILKTLKDLISPTRPIHAKKQVNAMRLKFNSKRMVDMIANYITIDNKSINMIWPNNIPNDYIKHFIRGYMDGDGNIQVKKARKATTLGMKYYYGTRLRILGTQAFLTGMVLTLNRLCGSNIVKPNMKSKENIHYIEYNFSSADKVLNYLYKDSNIFLQRKYNVWRHILNSDSNTLSSNYGKKSGCYNTWSSPMQTNA